MSKIFDVSLSKTGTLSLYQAMKILGYKASHGPGRHPEDFVTKTLQGRTDYKIIQNNDYVGNLLAFAHEKLSRAYPDAKFIFLTRNMEPWVASMRAQLKKVPFCQIALKDRKLTAGVLGRLLHLGSADVPDSDDDSLREIYRRHSYSVLNNFPPDDPNGKRLLIMNIEDGWEPLCRFLDKSIPDVPFPHLNRTASCQKEESSDSKTP